MNMLERSPDGRSALDASMPIDLDFQATTRLDPRVLELKLPYLSGPAGNPHSTSHLHGIAALKAVETAREEVADLTGASADEIVFTSGATEANNLLIRGAFGAKRKNGRRTIVTATTEHKAVLEVAAHLKTEGAQIQHVPVSEYGLIDLDRLKGSVDDSTALVTVMTANTSLSGCPCQNCHPHGR
ncbi:aminotransferase class V-fold PLP-dependent enzyme [Sinorhizobium meliloti]|uniref:aminotransferase class V-fold PLP-dependent enzyme n=1 Tax=Rhizobium meliloti TaxID=382 RepID=UPI002090F04D|nr:aminotransferase class V-fold PLP-dependent enzyme [Sinorhizobium meliloti]MCO5966142.1 aminotransferase class V-fold PLP-dependent enzyme [Sinorhizobium meliloti]